ncbi:MAG: hypothetical protein DRI57_10240, partial [Deltaproteobacteria bacterium]
MMILQISEQTSLPGRVMRMIKTLRRLFSKTLPEESGDVVAFAKAIESIIDETSLKIFRAYKDTLLAEPNIYIVPAVWGATKDGELTDIQREIHAKILPSIREILKLLHQENIASAQDFAIGYLVRGLFISKIIYMIEFY